MEDLIGLGNNTTTSAQVAWRVDSIKQPSPRIVSEKPKVEEDPPKNFEDVIFDKLKNAKFAHPI
jgi:hypothetical protein